MGPSPQCYIPSHTVIGPLVLEKKIFERFLPYMGVAAILVMWPAPREQTFVTSSRWGSIWNLVLTGPAVLEKKIFENGGRRTDDWPWPYYKLTNEPKGSGELISSISHHSKITLLLENYMLVPRTQKVAFQCIREYQGIKAYMCCSCVQIGI